MPTWSVYLIQCHNKNLYTGISTDVSRRFKEHQSNSAKSAKFLRGKGPLRLVFKAEIGNRSQASMMEAKIKKLTRLDKERLICGKLSLPHLQE